MTLAAHVAAGTCFLCFLDAALAQVVLHLPLPLSRTSLVQQSQPQQSQQPLWSQAQMSGWSANSLVLAAELSEIQARGHLIVGVKDNLRPLGFRDRRGSLVGFEIDLARQLAADLLGDPDAIVFQPIQNTERIPILLTGEVDLVVAQLAMTGARSRLVNFSYPYYFDGASLVTRNSNIQEFADLSNRTIAVLNHATTIDIVRDRIPGAALVGVDSYVDALATLEAGEADAFAGDASVLAGWVQDYPRYRILPTVLSAEPLAIALPRGLDYEPLRQAVNQSITQWQASGWLQERHQFWGLP